MAQKKQKTREYASVRIRRETHEKVQRMARRTANKRDEHVSTTQMYDELIISALNLQTV